MKKLISIYCFLLPVQLASAQVLFANEKLDSTMITAMEGAIQNGIYPNVHSILIAHNNKIVYEKYWAGTDRKDGKDVGIVPHGVDSLHGIQSISKSIVSASIGIAMAQGRIKSLDQKVFEFFPEYASQKVGMKAGITIKVLLTMTCGLQWDEENYSDPENNEHQMYLAQDPVGYVLTRPMKTPPGKSFNYNGGTTQVLAAIIQKTTGKTIETFTNEYLFGPLDISDFRWTTCYNSEMADAFSGLYLRSRDIMKFGLLYLNNGKWNSKQVIPANWIKQSVTPYVIADDGLDILFGKSEYGFQWWLLGDTIMNKPIPIAACIGNGGQRVFVDKANGIVVVFTGGNYRQSDLYLNPYNILKKFIYPALFKTE